MAAYEIILKWYKNNKETFPVDADALPDAPQVKVDVRVRFDKQSKARIVLTPDKELDHLHQTALEEALAYAFNEQSKEDKLHWPIYDTPAWR